MARASLVLVPLMLITIGCQKDGMSSSVRGWVDQRGGLATCAAAQERLQSAAGGVVEQSGKTVRLHVLASTDPGAWSWPTGEIFVSQALLNTLSDDELAAVVAHEIGHLQTHARHATALAGKEDALRAEIDADARAIMLLRAAGRDPEAMGRVLHKLTHDARLPAATRRDLSARLAHLPGF